MKYLFLCAQAFAIGVIVSLLLIASEAVTAEVPQLSNAVLYMMGQESFHPKKDDAEWATEIAEAVKKAAAEFGYQGQEFLFVSMGHWETHFRPDILKGKTKGPAGEIGLLQCGRDCARHCPYFMDTVEGQAMCGVMWFKEADKACNDGIDAAMTYYASGTVCDSNKIEDFDERNKLKAKVKRRTRLAERLKNRFGG